ncbi:transmembrane protein 238-like [Tamandua tetradactyla]|uniref:transmembrane protein 238-like n=1 Tax=Tamandua tetradactyla TaxID=48850 RepID=UPI004053A27B
MLLGRPWGGCKPGRCVALLTLALVFDATGLTLLLLGIFAPLSYWDFLVYTGALVLALSLLFWVTWYSINIEVPLEELDL